MKIRAGMIVMVVIGCIVCAGCQNPLEGHYLRTSAAHAAVDLHALQQIRRGDTNGAIYTLERDLNMERVQIESFMGDPEKESDQTIARLWKKVRAYQEEHPWIAKTNRNQ